MRDQPAAYAQRLGDAGFEVRYPRNPQLARGGVSEAEMIAELGDVQATIASSEPYTASLLAALPQLRVIARCGVGYDAVDVAAATRQGIPVTITPTANHEAVAELALGLIFGVAKRIADYDRQVRAGKWPRQPLLPLRGRTLGIFGLGRIGTSLARRGRALGMQVIATETFPNLNVVRAEQIELVDFETLLARSDYLSIHCPLNDETWGRFDAAAFARMKAGSVLINTARGKVVVEKDLLAALAAGRLAGAGLDVFEQEPPALDNPLLQLENVVVSPHIAGVDELSIEAMGLEAADCIVKLYQGQWPAGAVVNDELQNGWQWRG